VRLIWVLRGDHRGRDDSIDHDSLGMDAIVPLHIETSFGEVAARVVLVGTVLTITAVGEGEANSSHG
jgi:hypothetical protein